MVIAGKEQKEGSAFPTSDNEKAKRRDAERNRHDCDDVDDVEKEWSSIGPAFSSDVFQIDDQESAEREGDEETCLKWIHKKSFFLNI